MRRNRTISFCGVDFWDSSIRELIDQLKSTGGYVVVPSAPSFAASVKNRACERALKMADYAIVDSGLMAVAMMSLLLRPVTRISGLRLLQHLLLYHPEQWMRDARVLWVSPNKAESVRIRSFLARKGFSLDRQTVYEAPHYQSPEDYKDHALNEMVNETAPDLVVMCIAGNKQERIAYHLRASFGQDVAVICTGAAMAFLTGGQAYIPTWADRCYLGWFARILQDPVKFLPRYFKAGCCFPQVLALHLAQSVPKPQLSSAGKSEE